MALTLTFNGRPFDLELAGYTTANVEGRGVLDRDLTLVNVPGRDGPYVLDQTLPARTLRIHYRLVADRASDFLQRLNALHDALHIEGDSIIQLSDETHYRMGRLHKADDPPYDAYRGFGSFDLLCADPYKYKDLPAQSGTSLTASGATTYPHRIRSIAATLTAGQEGLTISNITTGRRIVLTGAFSAGQTLLILPGDGRILLNGQNIMSRLDYITSDWHDFEIYSGNQITSTANLTLNLSERAL